MNTFPGFPKELFTFLKKLSENNDRTWFNANKDSYIRYAREPCIAFILAMKDRLEGISPSYVADTRTNGGSMFRIYRDARFSKNKQPYKENIGCQFRHVAGKDVHAPGFYVHIQPNENFVGGGIWLPPSAELYKIRTAIDKKQIEWLGIKEFVKKSENISYSPGESLKRPPQGFSADHPLIDDLKQKTFFVGRDFTNKEVTSPEFIDLVEAVFHDLSPLMRFINEALDLSF
ncbi:MAG: DUF2461 domain-containing protein [Spirochaetales bacterium]|nr:DUF2461 domain-containing protein [Spirochaetales bacterium]